MEDGYYVECLRQLATLRRRERSSCHDRAILTVLDRWANANDNENVNKVLDGIPALPPLVKRVVLQFLLPPVNRKFLALQGPRWVECGRYGMEFCLFFPRDHVGVCKFPAVPGPPVILNPGIDEDYRELFDNSLPSRLFDCYPHEVLLVVSWVRAPGCESVELVTTDSNAMQSGCYSSHENIFELMCQVFPKTRYYWLPFLFDICTWVLKRQPYAFENTRKGYLCYLSEFLRKHIQPVWHALCDRHEEMNVDGSVLERYIMGNYCAGDEDAAINIYDACHDDHVFAVFESCQRTLDNFRDVGHDLTWIQYVRQHLFEDIFEAIQEQINDGE